LVTPRQTLRRSFSRLPTALRAFYDSHAFVHHGLTFRASHVSQFADNRATRSATSGAIVDDDNQASDDGIAASGVRTGSNGGGGGVLCASTKAEVDATIFARREEPRHGVCKRLLASA
jgi:hypothetical protein